jgi:hypothetical protein
MILDGGNVVPTSAATIKKLLEVLLKEVKVQKE